MKIPDKDTGKRVKYKTGAIREKKSTARGRFDMRLTRGLQRVALRYELGGIKYKDSDNFLKGMNLRQFLDSANHHIGLILQGRVGEDHAAAATWNLLALMELQGMIAEGLLPEELDNLPRPPKVDKKKMKKYFKERLPFLEIPE